LSKDNACDPESQWFKLVNSTRSSTMTKLWLGWMQTSISQQRTFWGSF
jgi:hypothetical protein